MEEGTLHARSQHFRNRSSTPEIYFDDQFAIDDRARAQSISGASA
jgi:hypothetical protein